MESAATQVAVREIRTLHEAALVGLRKGDLDSVMAVYADDVISQPPGQPARVGKAAVRSMWEEVLAGFHVQVHVNILEVHVTGDWAFERGTFEMQLSPKVGGPSINDTGKYLDVLRQAGGEWRYWRVTWNSSQPPAG